MTIQSTLKNKKYSLNSDKGFTIVELLIVIIVIGILATLVLVAYNNVQGQARDTKRQSSATSVANGAEQFKTGSLAGTYPRMDSGANFQSDLNNGTLYSNGTPSIAIDASITNPTVNGSVVNKLSAAPGAGTAADNLSVTFCPAGATNLTATGLKIGYYSESSKTTKFSQTGTGC